MHDIIPAAWIMLGAVLAVMLIACANVAGLFLTDGTAHARRVRSIYSYVAASVP